MKTKVPYLMKLYTSRWHSKKYNSEVRWDALVWREAFGNPSKLPMTSNSITIMSVKGLSVSLYLDPPAPKGVKKHRVCVVCPRCLEYVFAGRVHQHKCEQIFQFPVQTLADAKRFLLSVMNILQEGFHPDTPASDYKTLLGEPLFTVKEQEVFDRGIIACFEQFDMALFKDKDANYDMYNWCMDNVDMLLTP